MRLLLACVAALAVGVALLVGWLLLAGDPDRLVQRPLPEMTTASVEAYAGGCRRRRLCQDVTLDPQARRPIRIALSLPRDAGDERLPAVILAGGLRTGRSALELLGGLGRNAVIAYEYPLAPDHWRRGFLPGQIIAARSAALAVPGQLAAVVRWTRAQAWADPARVSLVGVSLGALVLPAAQRTAAAHGETVAASILAYGGTDLGGILAVALAEDRPWLRRPVAWLGRLGLRALEPAAHLPHLQGAFLLINGRDDARIPPRSSAELQRLTPPPKTVRMLSSGHIDTDRRQLVREILAVSEAWLIDRGALNRGSHAGARGSPPATAPARRRIPRRRARLRAA